MLLFQSLLNLLCDQIWNRYKSQTGSHTEMVYTTLFLKYICNQFVLIWAVSQVRVLLYSNLCIAMMHQPYVPSEPENELSNKIFCTSPTSYNQTLTNFKKSTCVLY